MSRHRVRVLARFEIKWERIDDFISAAREMLVKPSRTDRGCLRCDLCQELEDPARFAMVEEWENEEVLQAHLAQPWLKEAIEWLGPMSGERPAVTRLRDVSEAWSPP